MATAIASTGTGEFLTAIRFAAACDENIRSDEANNSISAISRVMENKILSMFLSSKQKRRNESVTISNKAWMICVGRSSVNQWMKAPVAGMIGLTWFGNRGEFIICHNSENMVYAYTGTSLKNRVKVSLSLQSGYT